MEVRPAREKERSGNLSALVVVMDLANLKLPAVTHGELPASLYRGNSSCRWLDGDDEYRYAETGGHPLYGPDSVEYSFNSFGYRCPEFSAAAEVKVISIGCSEAFGIGLPQQALFHELFCDTLRQHCGKSVVNWNIAEPGASCDYVLRMLLIAVPLLQPDLVIVNFPMPDRREYCSADGYRLKLLPAHLNRYREHRGLDECMKHLGALVSDYDSQLNVFRNYKSVEVLLKDIPHLFSFCHIQQYRKFLGSHLSDPSVVGDMGPRVDTARDHRHCGPETHRDLFERCWAKFCELGLLERFSASA